MSKKLSEIIYKYYKNPFTLLVIYRADNQILFWNCICRMKSKFGAIKSTYEVNCHQKVLQICPHFSLDTENNPDHLILLPIYKISFIK